MSRAAYLAGLERQRLLSGARRAQAKAEAQAVAEGVAETVALSIARGGAFEVPADARRGKPYRRQAGLDWLAAKGRLSPAQRAAGERYGACYRRARGEIAIASTLDVKPGLSGGTGAPLSEVLAKAEANAQARARLAAYRRRLWDQSALVAACDKICGEELTPREAAAAEREASRLEAVLAVALDILAGA
ncbi:hypothetical protein [Phenylobacterium sp.]|uniref:hypothetical protein n=1 Tax=Phenylobacterium sp. TaxID=1871053 RepID=UPI002733434F|nr:hypothetical protein [Phenylobacterium sp.]MDP3854373.1 hypothetical protein [Phenylobacterium sp.]